MQTVDVLETEMQFVGLTNQNNCFLQDTTNKVVAVTFHAARLEATFHHDQNNSYHGSYRSSIVKFPDFSSHGITIALILLKQ